MNNEPEHNPIESDDCLFCFDHLDEAALGILEPDDRERFEHHLARCRICRAELTNLDSVLQYLPFSCEVVPPSPEMKTNLQQRFAEAVRAEDAAKDTKPTQPPVRSRRLSVGRTSWTYGSVFAGLCVALAVIALWNVLPFDTASPVSTRGNMQVYAMQPTCEDCDSASGGHIGADPDAKDGTVMAWNLDPNQTHEVWCVEHDGRKTKIGELDVAESGSVVQTLSFPDAVGAYQQIYVSRNDGTQELSVTPSRDDTAEPTVPVQSSPATD